MDGIYHARFANGLCSVSRGGQVPDGPESLSGSVGEGGQNRPADVLEVQERLNAIATDAGGPIQQLAEDGICGGYTKAAILKFQRRWPELLKDGRIDPDKNTWKKLVSRSVEFEFASAGTPLPKVAAFGAKPSKKKKSSPDPPAVQLFLTTALHLTQYRIFAAIQSLDQAGAELAQLEAFRIFSSALKPMTLHQAYQAQLSTLVELPQVDRCFHLVNPNMTLAGAKDVLRRLRKVFADMLDVIVATIITTPAAEKSDEKRFVRSAPDAAFKKMYPPSGAIANAQEGGWWKKNANKEHILYNASFLAAPDVCTTLLHEMSHFVSHFSSYQVGDHHKSGLYQGAFNDTHYQAVRNSFCYEWYAMLAQFKFMRPTPNASLPSPL
jgi:hypothetical protein